jgi:hypothetical protein
MNTLIESLRDIIGVPDFWVQMETNNNYGNTWQWDYGAMLEYMLAGILICVVVSSVFKFLRCLLK